jgi:glycosyltransferase involved in cell wall biosynthesis
MVRDAGLGSKVTILGARLDVPRLLTAADVFVLPSRLEGVPFAVCEALAFGCPVIATAVGGVPEILTHRVNGLLVDPEDSGKLAKMIRYALSSERIRDRLSRNGRSTAERLSSTGMFAQSFALLEERDPASSGAVDDGGM